MENKEIGHILIDWYQENGRELPWRMTKNPYLIWISEVILQQTRVEQGLDYFLRFTARFPDVCALAEASEDEVLLFWQGLGYYSRARNLHAAAQSIMKQWGGVFPRTWDEIRTLKGVGDYTASAIASFAFSLPYAVVDGNVYRFLARLFAIDIPIDTTRGKRYFTALAQELLLDEAPDLFNQAIMEFGALQCVPRMPDCFHCPFEDKCRAKAEERIVFLPVKVGKIEVKHRYFIYFHIHDAEGTFLLQRREKSDIWRNLYEFPLLETTELMDFACVEKQSFFQQLFCGVERMELIREVRPQKHVLSHQVIHAVFYEIKVSNFSSAMHHFMQIPRANSGIYAVSRLMRCYWERV